MRLLLIGISGIGPVKPFPTRCNVDRLDILDKHNGIDP